MLSSNAAKPSKRIRRNSEDHSATLLRNEGLALYGFRRHTKPDAVQTKPLIIRHACGTVTQLSPDTAKRPQQCPSAAPRPSCAPQPANNFGGLTLGVERRFYQLKNLSGAGTQLTRLEVWQAQHEVAGLGVIRRLIFASYSGRRITAPAVHCDSHPAKKPRTPLAAYPPTYRTSNER